MDAAPRPSLTPGLAEMALLLCPSSFGKLLPRHTPCQPSASARRPDLGTAAPDTPPSTKPCSNEPRRLRGRSAGQRPILLVLVRGSSSCPTGSHPAGRRSRVEPCARVQMSAPGPWIPVGLGQSPATATRRGCRAHQGRLLRVDLSFKDDMSGVGNWRILEKTGTRVAAATTRSPTVVGGDHRYRLLQRVQRLLPPRSGRQLPALRRQAAGRHNQPAKRSPSPPRRQEIRAGAARYLRGDRVTNRQALSRADSPEVVIHTRRVAFTASMGAGTIVPEAGDPPPALPNSTACFPWPSNAGAAASCCGIARSEYVRVGCSAYVSRDRPRAQTAWAHAPRGRLRPVRPD